MTRNNDYLVGNTFAKGSGPNSTSFKPGIIPWNTGTKGATGANAGSFKPGVSLKTVPIGTITIRKDKKTKTPRRWIKTESGWVPYAKHLWCKTYGEIPPGCLIHHLDFDSLNDELGNYAPLTRGEHAAVHGAVNTNVRRYK